MASTGSETTGRPWEPGVWKRFPWITAGAYAGVLICSGGAAAVLADSNNKPVNSWPSKAHQVQVSTILSILLGVANFLLGLTVDQGATIAWWIKALNGATLKQLHYYHDVNGDPIASVLSGWNFNRIALVTLVTFGVGQANGPLLQASSTVTTRTMHGSVDVSALISPNMLPPGYTGFSGGDESVANLLTPQFSTVSRAFNNRSNIAVNFNGCEGTCNTQIPAAGLDYDCTTSQTPYDFSTLASVDPNNNNITVVSIRVAFDGVDTPSQMNVTTIHKPSASCAGVLNVQHCVLRLAQVRYPISLANGTAALLPRTTNETIALQTFANFSDQVRSLSNGGGIGNTTSTLGGFALVATDTYSANITLQTATTISGAFVTTASGDFPNNYITSPLSTYSNCTMTWADPTPDILAGIRELMFRAAVAASTLTPTERAAFAFDATGSANTFNATSPVHQTLPAAETVVQTVFKSHWGFFGGALATILLNLLAVTYLFERFWELGRDVSLSPLEVAKAFGAAMLKDGDSNAGVEGLLRQVGETRVMYGDTWPLPGEGINEKGVQSNGGGQHERAASVGPNNDPSEEGISPAAEMPAGGNATAEGETRKLSAAAQTGLSEGESLSSGSNEKGIVGGAMGMRRRRLEMGEPSLVKGPEVSVAY